MLAENIHERADQLKPDSLTAILPGIIQKLERGWIVLRHRKQPGRNFDTPQQSLLRVAHHSLSALLELETMEDSNSLPASLTGSNR